MVEHFLAKEDVVGSNPIARCSHAIFSSDFGSFKMVKVSVKEISSCERLLTVAVPSEEVEREYSTFYDQIAKVARVPGFRPGKAPRNVLALHYAQNAREEVLKKLIPRSLREAFSSKNIAPIGNPSIERINFDTNRLSYDAHVEIQPKIKIDRYKGIVVKQKPIIIDDSEIEEVLKQIQESHAKFVPVVNRSAAIGDFLICDYICYADGKEIEKRSEDMVALKEKDYLEGFSNQLVGVQPGEIREIHIKFPANYVNKTYANKEGVFKVTVKEIKSREIPVLSDEFAKETGDFQTLAELKEKVRQGIESRKKDDQNTETEKVILEEILKHSKFEIPKRMVEKRLESMIDEALHTLKHQGLSEEDETKKREEMREKFKSDAERQVRLSFVLSEIAEREKIKPEEPDFKSKYQVIAERYRRPVEEVETHFEKSENSKESLALQITTEKVIQFLKDNAIVKTIS